MISHRKYITRNLSCQINVLFPYHMWLQYTIDKRLMTTRYHDNIINKFLTLKIYPSNNNNIKWDIRVNHIFIFRYVNLLIIFDCCQRLLLKCNAVDKMSTNESFQRHWEWEWNKIYIEINKDKFTLGSSI